MIKTYRLTGIDCAVCAQKTENALRQKGGFKSVNYHFASQRLTVEYENRDEKEVFATLCGIVKAAEPGASVSGIASEGFAPGIRRSLFTAANFVKLLGALAYFAALALEFLALNGEDVPLWRMGPAGVSVFAVYLAAYFLIAHDVLWRFSRNLVRLRFFDENFLMTVATAGAFALGECPEAVAIMLFFQIGETFQKLAVQKSRDGIRRLIGEKNELVTVLKGGQTAAVEPESVNVGDKMLIKAGERVRLDGVVTAGVSALDTSMLTGESLPRPVGAGDDILSGSVNLNNPLTADVTKNYSDSTVTKILDMVENAAAKKAKSEQFITKFSRVYTPLMVAAALVIGIAVPLLFGFGMADWVRRALVFLLVACPCALVLSIPMCYFGGIGAASKRGILFKGADYLDTLARLQTVIFDKTGTLTTGVFEITDIVPAPGITEAGLLDLAAHIESMSNHPLARAVVQKCLGEINSARVSEHKDLIGFGVYAVVDGKPYLAGNAKLMEQNGITMLNAQRSMLNADQNNNDLSSVICHLSFDNDSVIHISSGSTYLGSITLSDQIKSGAREAVENLRGHGVKELIMLTGDKEDVAKHVSNEAGCDDYRSGYLPADKMVFVQGYSGKRAAFVGEGINDVLALSAADVGISMGALGSDAAMDAANVVLMTDEPGKIATAVLLARRTRFLALFNIGLVLLVKILTLILFAACPSLPLFLAEAADVGIALVAVGVAMTILRYNPERNEHGHIHAHEH
ncbi:MAG: heavy metal translocating P-type ATPase [Firmicutes bacterium]|nr:heavy metal translocating P-type ATPase [Bacillota bacterium]